MNIDSIRYLSFDLDGTLLNSQGKLSPYTKQIIMRLQEEGYIVILNSGRFYHELESFCEELELAKYGGYAVCSNGYLVYDAKNDTYHCNTGISAKEAEDIFRIAKKNHLFIFLHFEDAYHMYATSFWKVLIQIGKYIARIPIPYPHPMRRYIQMYRSVCVESYNKHNKLADLEKMCFIGLPYFIERFEKAIHKESRQYQFFKVNTYSSEIANKGVSKAEAVDDITFEDGRTMHTVMAFGDAGNDVPLFQYAGIGVCMKNAKTEVSIRAKYDTLFTNDEDGVAKFLEDKFFS